jgi:hypothetical protein
MKRVCLAILVLGLAPLAAPAQQAPAADAQQAAAPEMNPVSNALRKLVAEESKDTFEAVEEMPADKFSFRPTPQQITFGHLTVHMVRANYGLCSLISGVKAPKMPDLKDEDPKDTQSLAQVDDSKFGEQVPFIGGKLVSRGFMVVTMAQDYGDHYSMAAMYLRLNGLLPPTAQPKK